MARSKHRAARCAFYRRCRRSASCLRETHRIYARLKSWWRTSPGGNCLCSSLISYLLKRCLSRFPPLDNTERHFCSALGPARSCEDIERNTQRWAKYSRSVQICLEKEKYSFNSLQKKKKNTLFPPIKYQTRFASGFQISEVKKKKKKKSHTHDALWAVYWTGQEAKCTHTKWIHS